VTEKAAPTGAEQLAGPTAGDLSLADPPLESPQPRGIEWLRGLAIDLRSLALFRIALGLCLLVDLLIRLPQIPDFYTDDGVLPRVAIIRLGNPWRMSLHLMSGEWAVQLGLFLIAIVLAIGFVVGYRTRFCAVASWVLLMSMHFRNPMIAHGGDTLMRLLFFWGMFVPLNARFSVDRALNPAAPPLPTPHLSAPGVALIFQICTMYWSAFAEKMHPSWLTERSAVYYALNLDMFASQAGQSLLDYPALMATLTSTTLLLELLGPLVAISPFLTTPARLAAVAAFVGFHGGLAVTLRLGSFSWISMAAWMLFLPPLCWEVLNRRMTGLAAWGPTAARWTRRVLGRWLSAPAPTPPGIVAHLVVLGALALVALSIWSKPILSPVYLRTEADYRDMIFGVTGLGQRWRMFAPRPSIEDGWYVMDGFGHDGTVVDVWNGGQPSDAKPVDFTAAYPTVQWLSYLGLLYNRIFYPFRTYFGDYLCRRWNDAHSDRDQVEKVTVYFMLETTPPPGMPLPRPEKDRMWRQSCIGEPSENR
jgi:hypothetical protein